MLVFVNWASEAGQGENQDPVYLRPSQAEAAMQKGPGKSPTLWLFFRQAQAGHVF